MQYDLFWYRDNRQEHVAKRFDDAFELMQDMLTAQPVLTSKPFPATSPLKNIQLATDKKLEKTAMSFPESNNNPRAESINNRTSLLGTYTKNHKAGEFFISIVSATFGVPGVPIQTMCHCSVVKTSFFLCMRMWTDCYLFHIDSLQFSLLTLKHLFSHIF